MGSHDRHYNRLMKLACSEFSDEIKKCYYYFFEQVIALGLGPEEQGYRVLLNVVRRLILFPEENDQYLLNVNLEEFIMGMSYARLDRQREILKVVLGLLPPYYQSQVINIILRLENSDHSDTFARDQTLAGQLAFAISEMEGNYTVYLNDALELQKLVEQHLNIFKEGLNAQVSEELVRRMRIVLETIVSSIDSVPLLIKIMCHNIMEVSDNENEAISRISGFFINRYLGGRIVRRNEAIFAKNSTGELISTCIRTYILKFLQSLATKVESDKLMIVEGPLSETLTHENRAKLADFLKILSQVRLEKEEPSQLHSSVDWVKLSRMEQDLSFKARYYTIVSLFQQLKEVPSPQKISTPRLSIKLRRSLSHTDTKSPRSRDQNSSIPTEPLKGLALLDLLNELYLYVKSNKNNDNVVCLYEDTYFLSMDFISCYLIKLCRLPKVAADDVQRIVWSPRVNRSVSPLMSDNDRVIILTNIDLYLKHITRTNCTQLGITYLLYHINQMKTHERYGAIYKKLCESLVETSFVNDNDTKIRIFEKLINSVYDWINGNTEKSKEIETKSKLLGELLLKEKLTIDDFSKITDQQAHTTNNNDDKLRTESFIY